MIFVEQKLQILLSISLSVYNNLNCSPQAIFHLEVAVIEVMELAPKQALLWLVPSTGLHVTCVEIGWGFFKHWGMKNIYL